MHWSLLVVVVLFASGLAQNQFSADAPGYSGSAYAIAGALTAVGLFIGVLLHELGHALVARRRGLQVDGITLSWMGGVTRIEGDTGSALNELLVAGVGPLISLALGGLLAAGRLGLVHLGAGALSMAALGWLAWINIALALFNLLPASPLDGGRVVHGLVWLMGRDRWRATRVAAGAGVVFGLGFVLLGLVVVERNQGYFLNGVLLGMIGWWLFMSARVELGTGAMHRALDDLTVAQVMRPVGEAPGWITVRAFMEQYASVRPGWVWLLQDWTGSYSGVIVGDFVSSVPYPNWDLIRPLDFATPVAAVGGADPSEDVLAMLTRTGGRQVVLVVGGGRTLGAVLPADVAALVRMRGGRLPGQRTAPVR